MAKRFDYEGARKEGYSDEEITGFLAEQHPDFDLMGAQAEGYSPSEINEYLSSYKPQRSKTAKAARVATQFGLGAAEKALLPLELGLQAQSSKEAQQVPYRENVAQDIERLLELKSMGQFDEQDEALLQSLKKQMGSTEESGKFVQTGIGPVKDISLRGLAEKATGTDLHPEGVLEKAANWTAWLKSGKGAKELIKIGTSPKELMKAIIPGQKSVRGLTAGTALQIAEDGGFGPLGTMASAVVGDAIGGGLAGLGKGTAKALRNPKEFLAKGAATLANTKGAVQQDLAAAAKEAGFTRDLGTITNSDIVKMIQARLAASGLTGKPLGELRKQITSEVVNEYKAVGDKLGTAKFATEQEASEIGKEYLTSIRNEEKQRIGKIYGKARGAIDEKSTVSPVKLASAIDKLEKSLKPGSVKSTETSTVLKRIEELKKDIYDAEGSLKPAKVQDLINNKIELNDIVNYEVQGGQKQLLKGLIKELDNSITSFGLKNKEFMNDWVKANKEFSSHAKTFRNKNIDAILRSENPKTLMNKMNSPQGIKELRNALSITPEGRQVFKDIARRKLDTLIGDQMVDNVSGQLKLGTFTNLLKKGSTRELVSELLPKDAYKKLVKLQAHVARLAESAQKFFNASQSATAGADLATLGSIIGGFFGIFTGNPWLITTGASVVGAKVAAHLMGDAKFLGMVEDAVIAAGKNDKKLMEEIAKKAVAYVKEVAPGTLEAGVEDQRTQ